MKRTVAADNAGVLSAVNDVRLFPGTDVLDGVGIKHEAALALERGDVLLTLNTGGLLELRGDRVGLDAEAVVWRGKKSEKLFFKAKTQQNTQITV